MLLLVGDSARAAREPVEGELEPLTRLHEREPDMVGARGAVEIARRDQQTGRRRELGRDLPPVVSTVFLAQPQIEQAPASVLDEPDRAQGLDRELASLFVADALF